MKDRFGRILEKGEYKNGKKVGKWTLLEGSFYFNKSFHDKTETIKYRNGFPIKSKILIVVREEIFDEINLKIWFKTNSIQTIKSRYKYPKQKG